MLLIPTSVFPDEPDKQELLEKIYREHAGPMLTVAFAVLHDRADAEDAVQQAFIQIMDGIDGGIRIKNVKNIDQYMAICARHAAQHIAERRYRRREVAVDPSLMPMKSDMPPASDAAFGTAAILHCLDELKPANRELMFLKFACGLRDADIARSLGLDRSSVSKRIKRTLAKLKLLLERYKESER